MFVVTVSAEVVENWRFCPRCATPLVFAGSGPERHGSCPSCGFVKYDNLNGAEVNMVLFGVVDKATGGADQNIHAAFQHFQLLIVAVAAIGQAKLQASSLRQRFSVSVDLYRQFSRRGHN